MALEIKPYTSLNEEKLYHDDATVISTNAYNHFTQWTNYFIKPKWHEYRSQSGDNVTLQVSYHLKDLIGDRWQLTSDISPDSMTETAMNHKGVTTTLTESEPWSSLASSDNNTGCREGMPMKYCPYPGILVQVPA